MQRTQGRNELSGPRRPPECRARGWSDALRKCFRQVAAAAAHRLGRTEYGGGAAGRQKLQQLVRRGSTCTSSVRYRRAMMLLAFAGGNRVPVIAQLVQADEDTRTSLSRLSHADVELLRRNRTRPVLGPFPSSPQAVVWCLRGPGGVSLLLEHGGCVCPVSLSVDESHRSEWDGRQSSPWPSRRSATVPTTTPRRCRLGREPSHRAGYVDARGVTARAGGYPPSRSWGRPDRAPLGGESSVRP
jgi:hypothetical protein